MNIINALKSSMGIHILKFLFSHLFFKFYFCHLKIKKKKNVLKKLYYSHTYTSNIYIRCYGS